MRQILNQYEVAERTIAIAHEISSQFHQLSEPPDRTPLVVIGILSGGAMFSVDLVRVFGFAVSLGWAKVQSYRGSTSTSEGPPAVQMLLDWNMDLHGKNVLIVDDILETGATLSAVMDAVRELKPLGIQTAVLLRKPNSMNARGSPRPIPDYVGFDIGRGFVVGHGLDYDGRFRHLPGVWIL